MTRRRNTNAPENPPLARHSSASSYKIGSVNLGNPKTLAAFTRECYEWWREGCNCVACKVINSYEAGESSAFTMRTRMELLHDLAKGKHGDAGVWIGQMELFHTTGGGI